MARHVRDITKVLEDRIKELETEKAELSEQMVVLDRLIESFNATLGHERTRATKQLRLPIQVQTSGNIAHLAGNILADQQEHSLAQITEAVKMHGAAFGKKNPNRVVHFALVGMKRQGLAEIIRTGVWKATPKLLEQNKTGGTPTRNL